MQGTYFPVHRRAIVLPFLNTLLIVWQFPTFSEALPHFTVAAFQSVELQEILGRDVQTLGHLGHAAVRKDDVTVFLRIAPKVVAQALDFRAPVSENRAHDFTCGLLGHFHESFLFGAGESLIVLPGGFDFLLDLQEVRRKGRTHLGDQVCVGFLESGLRPLLTVCKQMCRLCEAVFLVAVRLFGANLCGIFHLV